MSYYNGHCEECDAEWTTSGYQSTCPFCKIEKLEGTRTPDHTDLVRQLVEALKERTGYYYQRDVPHQSQHSHCQCRECTDRRCDAALSAAQAYLTPKEPNHE